MEAYTSFAQVYDIFMDETPYKSWCDYLAGLLRANGIQDGLVLDLGCGTGTLTEQLAKQGYDLIGIDHSVEMLRIAALKKENTGLDILYLQQDMREFELYGTVRAVISVCDSLNYILEPEELKTVFQLVNNYLDPKGIFLFDFNTVYKYETVIGDKVIAENREDCSFIWDNYYDSTDGINEYDLTLFIKEKEHYRKFCETHYQRGYTLTEIKKLLQEAGLCFVSACDGDTLEEVTEKSERINVTARECGKVSGLT